jgi:hypothetical protein
MKIGILSEVTNHNIRVEKYTTNRAHLSVRNLLR